MTNQFLSREVESLHTGMPVSDGAGVRLQRVLTQTLQHRLDPFLMLDEFGSDRPDDYIAGFPDHPHRGFETVTYMLEGRMRHRDSVGNEGVLGPGDVQWMTAGRGVVHSEMPEQEEGRMRGFQLWVNLPARDKMTEPRYRGIAAADIPRFSPKHGIDIRVIAGELAGYQGAIRGIATDPLYLDVALDGDTAVDLPIAEGYHAFVYVYEGAANIGTSGRAIEKGQLAVLDGAPEHAGVTVRTQTGARLLVIAGRPINEPIAQWGPFVMNTREELEQAFHDYHNGLL
ncbi:MAG: pirin family protein [Paludibacterium sp.]|uniref:pirin family protein n=1 Tax=Paludibacterium sp. TaxID=1917523 RepID=UPI0025FB9115|nr:pirin family protein [Paludibacterium sp.]MBV8046679.1 pirin family protein [Paludibacterium sp.]MBV8649590.1 pirin family protein [Paludibacterium sp.]